MFPEKTKISLVKQQGVKRTATEVPIQINGTGKGGLSDQKNNGMQTGESFMM